MDQFIQVFFITTTLIIASIMLGIILAGIISILRNKAQKKEENVTKVNG